VKIERKWLMNRLKAMSVQEIVHRCRRLIGYFIDLGRFRAGWHTPGSQGLTLAAQNLFDNVLVEAASAPGSVREHDSDIGTLDQHRQQWLNNTLALFDAQSQYSLGTPVQWLTDPKTGVQTPRKFGRSIDYRNDQSVGEIKYLWEVGRHQFLVPMAIRVAFQDDDKVRAKLASHLACWLEQNPVGMGIHWCSSLEVGLRLISWSLIHGLLQSGGNREGIFSLDLDAEQLKVHIQAQVAFIAGNYSRYSSANNHLVGELTGVWVACNVFDLGAKGATWKEAAFAELETEAALQTHDDGVNKEQAIYYHLWSLEYFWLAWSVAKRYQQPVSALYEERLVDMYRFLDAMCSSTAAPAQVGDADSGVVCRFNPDVSDSVFDALLEPIGHVLNAQTPQVSCTPVAGSTASLYSKHFWYTQLLQASDTSAIEAIYQKKVAEVGVPDTFETGGYYVLRGHRCRVLFRAGPFGYLATAAHSHADALSITLAIDEHWWLVDPGTYTYHSSGEWRHYFRSTAAHNTLSINNTNQSEITGDFLWSRKTDVQVQCVERGEWGNVDTAGPQTGFLSSVSAWHDGYAEQGVQHQRTVHNDGEKRFELHDLVTLDAGVDACTVQLALHLHPDITLQQLDTHRWRATRQDSAKALLIELPVQFEWTHASGQLQPIAGWYSETYGTKQPSSSLLGHAVLTHTHNREPHLYRTSLVVHDIDETAAADGVA